jgi:hypothetical protein
VIFFSSSWPYVVNIPKLHFWLWRESRGGGVTPWPSETWQLSNTCIDKGDFEVKSWNKMFFPISQKLPNVIFFTVSSKYLMHALN